MRDESLNDTTISQVSNSEVSAPAAAALLNSESLNQTKMSLSSLNFGQIILTASFTAKADVLKLNCSLNTQQNSKSSNIYSCYPTKCVGWVMGIIDIKVSTLVHRVQ